MARLLTLLLLYHGAYGVGRYVSLEKIVETTRDSYYDTLRRSSAGWHEGAHDPWPWLEYFLGIIVGAYARFEERVGVLGGRGAKLEAIEQFVRAVPQGAEFRVADVRRNAAGAGDSHISKVLSRLRDEGLIAPLGRGRGARWKRLPGG
jgi:Fic family protein